MMQEAPQPDFMMHEALTQMHSEVAGRRYGKFRGFVVDNNDPEQCGRLKVCVPSVVGEDTENWAMPCLPFGGGAQYGWFAIPEVGAQVWVEFEEGNPNLMVWVGTFWSNPEHVPSAARVTPPTTRLFATPAGHVLQFDDQQGAQQIRLSHSSKASLVIDRNGTVLLTDANGARLTLDASAERPGVVLEDAFGNSLILRETSTIVENNDHKNRIEMNASGITVKGERIVVEGSQVMLGGEGGERLLKGDTFLSMFAGHTHTVGPAVSGPPMVPRPVLERALSNKVKTG